MLYVRCRTRILGEGDRRWVDRDVGNAFMPPAKAGADGSCVNWLTPAAASTSDEAQTIGLVNNVYQHPRPWRRCRRKPPLPWPRSRRCRCRGIKDMIPYSRDHSWPQGRASAAPAKARHSSAFPPWGVLRTAARGGATDDAALARSRWCETCIGAGPGTCRIATASSDSGDRINSPIGQSSTQFIRKCLSTRVSRLWNQKATRTRRLLVLHALSRWH